MFMSVISVFVVSVFVVFFIHPCPIFHIRFTVSVAYRFWYPTWYALLSCSLSCSPKLAFMSASNVSGHPIGFIQQPGSAVKSMGPYPLLSRSYSLGFTSDMTVVDRPTRGAAQATCGTKSSAGVLWPRSLRQANPKSGAAKSYIYVYGKN